MPSSPSFLLDENLSWRVARGMTAAGYSVTTTQSLALSGLKDTAVFRAAQRTGAIIITRDTDFTIHFTPPHHGIIVVRCPAKADNADILAYLLRHLPALPLHTMNDMVHEIYC